MPNFWVGYNGWKKAQCLSTEAKHFIDAFDSPKFPVNRKNGIPKIVKAEREAVIGDPNIATMTTCHIERLFLTVRQELKRY